MREIEARRSVLAVPLTVPSSDNEQCMREIEARRAVLAVLWREPGAWQERPSVTFTPRRCDNGPDRGGVSGCQGTEGPAHCMARPSATASLGVHPCGIMGVSGAGRRDIRKHGHLWWALCQGDVGRQDSLLVGAAHSLSIQCRMTSCDKEKARRGHPTCGLNPKKSGWMQRHVRLQAFAPSESAHPGHGGHLGTSGRIGWGWEQDGRLKQPRRHPGPSRFHVSRGGLFLPQCLGLSDPVLTRTKGFCSQDRLRTTPSCDAPVTADLHCNQGRPGPQVQSPRANSSSLSQAQASAHPPAQPTALHAFGRTHPGCGARLHVGERRTHLVLLLLRTAAFWSLVSVGTSRDQTPPVCCLHHPRLPVFPGSEEPAVHVLGRLSSDTSAAPWTSPSAGQWE